MKKIFPFFGLLALCFGVSSCNLDDSTNVNTYTFQVLNHISSTDPDGKVMMSQGSYSFRIDGNNGELRINTDDLLFDNSNHSFTTRDIKYSQKTIISQTRPNLVGNIFSFDAGENNACDNSYQTVTNLKGTLNSTVYPLGYTQATPVMSYNFGSDWKVRTTRVDAYYDGTTEVTKAGEDPVKADQAVFRVIINAQSMKAQIVMAFLPIRDLKDSDVLTLTGLPVTVTRDGYYIESPEATAIFNLDEGNRTWVFRNISFRTTSDDLTSAKLTMTLADDPEVTINADVSYTLF